MDASEEETIPMTTNQTSQLSSLKKSVAPYEKTDRKASIYQLINTLGPLVLLWTAAYFSLSVSYWLTLLFAVPAARFCHPHLYYLS